MPTKKKKTEKVPEGKQEAATHEATASPEPKEEKRPVVTHVVEVVEEESSEKSPAQSTDQQPIAQPVEARVESSVDQASVMPPKSPPASLVSEEKPELPKWKQEPYNAVIPATINPNEEEKRKEVVGELYDEKEAPVMPEIAVHTSEKSKTIVVIIGVALAVVLVGGGIFVVKGKTISSIKTTATPTPTKTVIPVATTSASPTPDAASIKRGDLSVQVLNGSGTPGAAGKMKKLLEDKGYKVAGTGNAGDYTYDKTEILVKKSKEAYLELLKSDIGENYTIGTAAATLPASSSYDARVTVGKK